jgi:D-beta-D-heptose 7-phosphate kinase/D-beta-D-heptose 1-phosphate adenosyltransferase
MGFLSTVSWEALRAEGRRSSGQSVTQSVGHLREAEQFESLVITMTPLVILGDSLLDRDLEGRVERVWRDGPAPIVEQLQEHCRPGGAALAATLVRLLDDRDVILVTAVADDQPGRTLRQMLLTAGVEVVDLGLSGSTPEKIRIMVGQRTIFRLDKGSGRVEAEALNHAELRALSSAQVVLVADYGHGLTANPAVRSALGNLARTIPIIWDPHQSGTEPVAGAYLVTPNETEAIWFARSPTGNGLKDVTARGRILASHWSAEGVAVTLGARGALLVTLDKAPLLVPAAPVEGPEPIGAGDRFATAALGLLADGASLSEVVVGSVAAASEFVARGGVTTLALQREPQSDHSFKLPQNDGCNREQAQKLSQAIRSRGGTIVATGGCFDILHAGHLATLQAARTLGDCLIVCLNSDTSVRKLKGPGRPLVPQADRIAILTALSCVDAVVVFDESTPEAILRWLRPGIFVKGGDYHDQDLPETKLLASWGGQTIILPYLRNRSTTGLIAQANQLPTNRAEPPRSLADRPAELKFSDTP